MTRHEATSTARSRLRAGLVGVAWTAVSLLLGLTSSQSLLHGLAGYPLPLRLADVVLGVVGLGLIWWRLRMPLLFAGYAVLIGPLSTLGSGLALVAACTVAVHRPWPYAVLTWLAAIGGSVLSQQLYPDPNTPQSVGLIAAALVLTVGTFSGMLLRSRREVLAGYRERAELAESERREQVEAARQAERTRIAREMHDVLAHRLSLLALHAGALEYRKDACPPDIAEAVQVIRGVAHEGLAELRGVIALLRDGDADEPSGTAAPQPSLADLPALVQQSRDAGVVVELVDETSDPVPAPVGRAVYRLVQEGLTNARKHAPGCPVDVRLHAEADGLSVEVRSPLPVHPPAERIPGSGTGLVGLRERVTLLGGQLWHGAQDGRQYRLRAWLPT